MSIKPVSKNSTIKLIYKNNKNNNNKTIKNAIRNSKNNSKTKTKKNYIKRKKIKQEPRIKIDNIDPNKGYVYILSSKTSSGNNYINWLVIIDDNNSKNSIIPYAIQNTHAGIYEFIQEFYSLDKNVLNDFINKLKTIIDDEKYKIKKTFGKNTINRELVLPEIIQLLPNRENLIPNDKKTFNVKIKDNRLGYGVGNLLSNMAIISLFAR